MEKIDFLWIVNVFLDRSGFGVLFVCFYINPLYVGCQLWFVPIRRRITVLEFVISRPRKVSMRTEQVGGSIQGEHIGAELGSQYTGGHLAFRAEHIRPGYRGHRGRGRVFPQKA